MAFTTIFEDVVFVEGDFPGAVRDNTVKSDLRFDIGAQLKSLKDIKHNLAKQAKKKAMNAVLDFEYGQKSSFFAWDNVGFWGKGVLATIPNSDYERIKSENKG